jgi:hypothetical protein
MEFESLEDLKAAFMGGGFDFPDEFTISGVRFGKFRSSEYSIEDMIKNNYKAMWLYFVPQPIIDQARKAGLDGAIVFLWGFDKRRLIMYPYDVRNTTKARIMGKVVTEKENNGDSVNIKKEKIVGDVVDVIVTSIPNSNIMKGKIDTGADVSSLHAEDWSIDNGQVTFTCPELSENKITLPVLEKQAIKSSNGDMEYRPVIQLNIKINNQQLTSIMFNLNDRGTMKYPVLIGQNVLEAGGFMIDPTIDDPDSPDEFGEGVEIDWESLQEEFKNDVITDFIAENENDIVKKIIDFIKNVE